MGDDGHNRNRAGTSLLIRELAPAIVKTHFDQDVKVRALEFLNSNDHTWLNHLQPLPQVIPWMPSRVSSTAPWFTPCAAMVPSLVFA